MTTAEANRLAACAIALSDGLFEGEDLSPSAIAALLSLSGGEKRTIGEIATIVGLTHSASVRLIDRLEKDWLVRRAARRGREVNVELTARGRHRAGALAKKRSVFVTSLLSRLPDDERAALSRSVDQILSLLVPEPTAAGVRTCRFCDVNGCGPNCPVPKPSDAAETA